MNNDQLNLDSYKVIERFEAIENQDLDNSEIKEIKKLEDDLKGISMNEIEKEQTAEFGYENVIFNTDVQNSE